MLLLLNDNIRVIITSMLSVSPEKRAPEVMESFYSDSSFPYELEVDLSVLLGIPHTTLDN